VLLPPREAFLEATTLLIHSLQMEAQAKEGVFTEEQPFEAPTHRKCHQPSFKLQALSLTWPEDP